MDVQTLIHARWVIPVDAPGALPHHAVAIDNGRITAVMPSDEARASITAQSVIERPNHAVLPGFVNAHTHAAMSLLRGVADDLPLMTWLQQHIWPLEGAFMSEDFVTSGARLAVAEMLRGGTTCFGDMYFFPEATAKAAEAAGIRAVLGMIVIDFPTAYASDQDAYFDKALKLHDSLGGKPLLSTMFAPHAPYTVSDEPLGRIRSFAHEMEVPVQMHVHETAQEVSDAGDQRPLARLDALGLVNSDLAAVHMTQLTDDEIELCARAGLTVVHCPESNLKLASGQCRTADLLAAGVNLAIGTDGAASNNDLDMLGELRSAALLAKVTSGSAAAMPAQAALEAATLGGARALGLAEAIGTITPGKSADLCAIDLAAPATTPVYDAVSAVVYAASRDQVSDVWVAGRARLERGQHVGLDWAGIAADANQWAERIAAHEPAGDPA